MTYAEAIKKRKENEGNVPYRQPEREVPLYGGTVVPDSISRPSRFASQGITSSPSNSVNMMPAVLKGVDLTQDRMQNAINYAKEGNYPAAAYEERLHNEKNGYLGLGYENSHIFNYDDPYLGDIDRQRAAIMEREPFSYDYRNDDLYKTILSKKEKEADKAYKDGYAQLSRQFDGDIPVNMLNKLQATKSEIIDQADNYIPQLYQLAREKYAEEGNKMLTDYNLTKQLADEDYARWRDDQNFIVSGLENVHARESDIANRIAAENAAFIESNDKYLSRQNDVTDTIVKIAENLVKEGKYSNMEDAIQSLMFIRGYYN